MSIILEPTEENVKWFANTVISEYLNSDNAKPNYKNLKWMLSSYDENQEYEINNLEQMFDSTVMDIYKLYDKQIPNMNITLKGYYLDTLGHEIKKLFSANKNAITKFNKQMILNIFNTLKTNSAGTFDNIIFSSYEWLDLDYESYPTSPNINFNLMENMTKIIKLFKISDNVTYCWIKNIFTEFMSQFIETAYCETSVAKLKKKYKAFNDFNDGEIALLVEIFNDGYHTCDIEIFQQKISRIDNLINSLQYEHDLHERKWKTFFNIINHYVANYMISYFDFAMQSIDE